MKFLRTITCFNKYVAGRLAAHVFYADRLNQLLNTAQAAIALVVDHMYPAGMLKYSIEVRFHNTDCV